MKFLIISSILAFASAKPSGDLLIPSTYSYVLGTPIQQQYHSQDASGQYAYGYSDGLSAKQESRSFDGVTRGGYSYIDANGKLQSVAYTADSLNGFRVAGTNLPKAPQPELQAHPAFLQPLPVAETPEVAAARLAHLRTVEEIKLRNAGINLAQPIAFKTLEFTKPIELPKPVEDTPEVAKAKLEHFAAKKEVELRNSNAVQILVEQPQPAVAIAQPALPIPVARIATHPFGYVQSAFRTIPVPSPGYNYGYSYANFEPQSWDSRYLVAGSRIFL